MLGYLSTLVTGYGSRSSEEVSVWGGVNLEDKVPLILCHGFLGDASQWYDRPGQVILVARQCGYSELAGFGADLGGLSTWGNDDFIDAVDDVIAWAGTTYGTRTDRVAIYGTSMGGCSLNWVWRNLDRVAACALTIPVVDLAGIHERNPIGLATFIEDAYGGAEEFEDALPTHDPSYPDNAELLASISDRVRIWYSEDDNVIDAAEVEAFAELTGVTAVNVGSVGHSVNFEQQQVADWLIPRMWWE